MSNSKIALCVFFIIIVIIIIIIIIIIIFLWYFKMNMFYAKNGYKVKFTLCAPWRSKGEWRHSFTYS